MQNRDKMVDSEYSPDNYKYLKISIGAITLEVLRFVSDHLKAKKICKNAVEVVIRNNIRS